MWWRTQLKYIWRISPEIRCIWDIDWDNGSFFFCGQPVTRVYRSGGFARSSTRPPGDGARSSTYLRDNDTHFQWMGGVPWVFPDGTWWNQLTSPPKSPFLWIWCAGTTCCQWCLKKGFQRCDSWCIWYLNASDVSAGRSQRHFDQEMCLLGSI